MKTILLHLIVAVGAFLLGLFFATLSQPVAESDTRDYHLSVDADAIRDVRIIDIFLRLPRFTETFRARRPGYVQGFVTNNGIRASEGSCNDNESRKPARVIERRKGRAVLEFVGKGEAGYEIRKFEQGRCSSVISSPSLEIALELEEYLQK